MSRVVRARTDPNGRGSGVPAGDLLIDTVGRRSGVRLIQALSDCAPRRILLTYHEDHAGGVSTLRAAWGELPVHAPRALLPVVARYREAF
jgi:glyoxylase-like metal-dependent hydrolase (beta-lactamase superfamily II)